MKADDIRKQASAFVEKIQEMSDHPTGTPEDNITLLAIVSATAIAVAAASWEIAAQLSELNEHMEELKINSRKEYSDGSYGGL
jgi:hypothetical protein